MLSEIGSLRRHENSVRFVGSKPLERRGRYAHFQSQRIPANAMPLLWINPRRPLSSSGVLRASAKESVPQVVPFEMTRAALPVAQSVMRSSVVRLPRFLRVIDNNGRDAHPLWF